MSMKPTHSCSAIFYDLCAALVRPPGAAPRACALRFKFEQGEACVKPPWGSFWKCSFAARIMSGSVALPAQTLRAPEPLVWATSKCGDEHKTSVH